MADEGKVPLKASSQSGCRCSPALCAGALLTLLLAGNLATNVVVIAQLIAVKNRVMEEEEEVFGSPDDLRLEVVQGLAQIAAVTTRTGAGDIVDCINAGAEYHPAFNATMRSAGGEAEEVLVLTMAMRCQNGDVLIYPPNSTDVLVARAGADSDGAGHPVSSDAGRKLWAQVAYYGYRYGVPVAMFAMRRYSGPFGARNAEKDGNRVMNTLNGNYLRRAKTMYNDANNWVYTTYDTTYDEANDYLRHIIYTRR